MRMRYELNGPARAAGPLRKLVALIVTVAVFVLALMFSAVLLVVIAIVGTIAGAYLWWKTREMRKMMRNMPPREMRREEKMADEKVFEGEVIRVVDSQH
ncbi:MAG: hypothetical protein PXX77_04655 [Gallionella sp.]|nr:hypothetical protein [Gallionella sp.]